MPNTEPTGRPHRNRGLFSDHYLNATLPARPDWQALAGEAEVVMAEISRVLDAYAPSQNEAQTEEDLVRPVLRALDHEGTYEVQPALATPEGTKRPDYVFYRDAASRDANKDRRLTDDLLRDVSFAVGDAKACVFGADASCSPHPRSETGSSTSNEADAPGACGLSGAPPSWSDHLSASSSDSLRPDLL